MSEQMKENEAASGQSELSGLVRRRILVFKERNYTGNRPMMWAIPEDEIREIETQYGSHNVYLKINGREVTGSFDDLIEKLGTRIDAF